MKAAGDDTTDHLMHADVKLGGSTVFVVISRASEGWPFVIENDSDYAFTLYQTVRLVLAHVTSSVLIFGYRILNM